MLFDKIKLEPDERILKTVRKHWFIITIELLGVIFMISLPILLLFLVMLFPGLLTPFLEQGPFGPVLGAFLSTYGLVILFGAGVWILFSIMTGFTIWTHYYLDLWVITDRRIILVDQVSFFNRNVSIFRLERMQDIEYKITGILATLLNFGTLKAQTAGAHESNFTSTGLPDPRGLQATIQTAMDARLGKLHIQADEVAMHH